MRVQGTVHDHLSDLARSVQEDMHDAISSKDDDQQPDISLEIHPSYRTEPAEEEIEEHEHDRIVEDHGKHLDQERHPICQSGEDIQFPYLEDQFEHSDYYIVNSMDSGRNFLTPE